MTPESKKAKAWRERMGLSRVELARLTGYSALSIYWFETGRTPERTYANPRKRGRAISPQVWLRFKRACHSVSTRERFEW